MVNQAISSRVMARDDSKDIMVAGKASVSM